MLAQNEEIHDGVNKLADYLNTIFEKISEYYSKYKIFECVPFLNGTYEDCAFEIISQLNSAETTGENPLCNFIIKMNKGFTKKSVKITVNYDNYDREATKDLLLSGLNDLSVSDSVVNNFISVIHELAWYETPDSCVLNCENVFKDLLDDKKDWLRISEKFEARYSFSIKLSEILVSIMSEIFEFYKKMECKTKVVLLDINSECNNLSLNFCA